MNVKEIIEPLAQHYFQKASALRAAAEQKELGYSFRCGAHIYSNFASGILDYMNMMLAAEKTIDKTLLDE